MSTTPHDDTGHQQPWTTPPPAPPVSERTRGFFNSIRGWGLYRSTNRHVGGVAGGLAARTGVDPLLIRGLAFVLILVFPFLLSCYGLAWLLLPEEQDGRIHLEQAFRGTFSSGFAGSLALTLMGLVPDPVRFGFGPWQFTTSGWAILFVLLALVVALIAVAGGNNNPTTTGTAVPPFAQPFQESPMPTTAQTQYAPYPPASTPSEQPASNPIPMIALAIWLIGTAGIWLAQRYGSINLPVFATSLALLVVVAGLGIIINGLLGRTAGALTFAAIAGIAVGLPVSAWAGGGFPATAPDAWFGEWSWAPTRVEDAAEGYSIAFGELNVDLRYLDLTESTTIPLAVNFGQLDVIVPDDIRVEADVNYGMGSVDWLGQETGGLFSHTQTYDNGVVAHRNDPVLHLDIRVAAGEANVSY